MKQHKALTLAVSVFLATFLSACQLPPLATAPSAKAPQSGEAIIPAAVSAAQEPQGATPKWLYSASPTEISELHRRYQTLGVGEDDLVIPAYSSWTDEVAASDILELLAARLDYPYAAGAGCAMVVSVNGQNVVSLLINKGQTFTLKDGRTLSYFYPAYQAWTLFYSPDFNLNNSPTSYYQVKTDPGQAYRYVWNISSLRGSGATMSLTIRNNGEAVKMPIVVRMAPSLKLKVETPCFSPNGDGMLDAATMSVKTSLPWKLSLEGKGTIARGVGSAQIAWDGKVDGQQLPDAQYRLLLEEDSATPSYQPSSALITVDTAAPEILDVDIVQDDPVNAPDTYRLVAKIKDTLSPIDRKSLKVTFSGNLNLSAALPSFEDATGAMSYSANMTESDRYAADLGGYLFGSPTIAVAYKASNTYRVLSMANGSVTVRVQAGEVAGNFKYFEKQMEIFNRPFISSLQIIKDGMEINRVRPLLDGEADYSAYDAIVCLKATVMRKSNKSVAGLPVQFDSGRVPNTGGHVNIEGDNHGENGPTGQFRLNDAFSTTVDPTSVDAQTATLQTLTDANGVATVWYRPYGFAGEEKLTAMIGSSTRTANLTIGLTNLVAMTQSDVLAIGDISSHPSGYYGTDITVKRMAKAAKLLNERVGSGFRVNGVSLPFGGPFDINHTWKINGGAHALHRSGFNSDFSLRLTDGVDKSWRDRDVWFAIAEAGGRKPLDEANELGGRKDRPIGRNDH